MEGKIYQEVDRFYPSSKSCHVCLNQVGSLPLDIRFWTCEHCHTKHDRDVNAAINLRDEGLRILTSELGEVSSPKARASYLPLISMDLFFGRNLTGVLFLHFQDSRIEYQYLAPML